eukprot:g1267.t1
MPQKGISNPVYAFVRHNDRTHLAFKPIIDSDYRLGYLDFRPAYLYLMLFLSLGASMFPPSSAHAVPRLIASMIILLAYYTTFAWLCPLRAHRRWILPIQLSIGTVCLLSIILSLIIELSNPWENGGKNNLVRGLSTTIVVAVILIIGVIIPAASIYELVIGAKLDIQQNKIQMNRKLRCDFHMSEKDLEDSKSFHNLLVDTVLDAEEHDELMKNLMRNRTQSKKTIEKKEKLQQIAEVEMMDIERAGNEASNVVKEENASDYLHSLESSHRTEHNNVTEQIKSHNIELNVSRSAESTPLKKTLNFVSNPNHTKLNMSRSMKAAPSQILPNFADSKFSVNATHGDWSMIYNEETFSTIYVNHRTSEIRDSRPKGWVMMVVKSRQHRTNVEIANPIFSSVETASSSESCSSDSGSSSSSSNSDSGSESSSDSD